MLLDIVFSEISWLAVAVACVLSFIIGGIWYSERAFGKMWVEDQPWRDAKEFEQGGANTRLMLIGLVFQALNLFILATLMACVYLFVADAFWAAFGFIALFTALYISRGIFHGHAPRMIALDVGYAVVVVIVIQLSLVLIS